MASGMKWMRLLLALFAVAMMSTVSADDDDDDGVGSIITKDVFDDFLKNRDNGLCHAQGFYTHKAFIEAAKAFPKFGNTGHKDARKKELAAFFGQTSQETSGAPVNGPYTWGYCYKEQLGTQDKYRGRGPIQLTGDYNYKAAGSALNIDLINKPDLVATDATISFKTAIWFWMTAQQPKPSCHDVILGNWTPSESDNDAHRVAGYGLLTNIINGGEECGKGKTDVRTKGRIGYYERYCKSLEVDPGSNLNCDNQKHFET